jgi:hypothetical protein
MTPVFEPPFFGLFLMKQDRDYFGTKKKQTAMCAGSAAPAQATFMLREVQKRSMQRDFFVPHGILFV